MSIASPDEEEGRAITGINVTPLVDVTLVLLIVFMVTAKVMMVRALPMEVPPASTHVEMQVVLAVTIDAAGHVALDGVAMNDADALKRAAAERAQRGDVRPADIRAVIAASTSSSHGVVISAIDALRSAGITKIGFAVSKKN
ncbi:MAG: biopolymer transporter ExbD [Labilithrix sp.]|nr:biopolymer transporter ExbD [Labilithrix sp.]